MGRNEKIFAAAAIFFISFALRLPTLRSPFVYDDFHSTIENPAVTGKINPASIFTDPSSFSSKPGRRMYRPLTILSYSLSYKLTGPNPIGWHLFNVIFHGLCAAIVFGIALRLFDEKIEPAFFAALLWAAHPLLNEAIVYQAARSSLLSGTFVAAGIYAHLTLKGEAKRAFIANLFFLLALASKETAVVMPVLILLIDIVRRENLRRKITTYASYAAITILYLLFRKAILDVNTFSVASPVRSVASNMLTQASVIAAYLSKTLWPMGLSIEWDWPAFNNVWLSGAAWWRSPLFGMTVIAAAVIAAFFSLRRLPILTMGIGWFFISLAPESSIIPLVQTANERRLYLPLIGIALAAAAIISSIAARPLLRRATAAAIIILFAALTIFDSGRWSDAESLWTRAYRANPSSRAALHSLASNRLEQKRLDSAEILYRRLLEEYPGYSGGYLGLGRISAKRGEHDAAEQYFLQAMKLDTNEYSPWINLSLLYVQQGKFAEAENVARKGIEIFPRSSKLWNNLGVALANRKRLDEAISAFDQALMYDPNYEIAVRNRENAMKDKKYKVFPR